MAHIELTEGVIVVVESLGSAYKLENGALMVTPLLADYSGQHKNEISFSERKDDWTEVYWPGIDDELANNLKKMFNLTN